MSFETCAVCGPKRTSRAICNCCKQYLCRDHLQEHDDLLNAQLEPLVDNVNELCDRLKQFNIESLFQPIRIQLDQWKQSAFQLIERIYQEKSNEINQFINKQLNNLRQQTEQTQQTISQLIRQQDATNEHIEILIKTIQNIEKETNDLQHKSIEVKIHPLILNDNYIHFNIEEEVDNNNELILTPIIEKISSLPINADCLANNDTSILLHRHPTLCLYDHNLNFINETHPYFDLSIIDMCWSSTLKSFLILTNEDIFILNETKMILEKSNIPTRNEGHWHNLTPSLTSLYLTAYKWGTSIYQYDIHSSKFQFNRRWKTPITCSKDESIDHFIHNNNSQIAMIIQNRLNNKKYFQLRNDQTLDLIWLFELNQCEMTIHRNRFSLINENQWLIIDSNQSKLVIFSQNGLFKQMIDYHFDQPFRALQIKSNFLLVTANHSINLHQLISNPLQ
jgi:hypothetical protein